MVLVSTYSMNNGLYCLLFILCLNYCSVAAISSSTGNILFYSNNDGQAEAMLNTTGLGLGVSIPSSNLHVNGNTIISKSLSVGSLNTQSNLHLSGSLGFSVESMSTNTTLSENSIVLVDSSGGNLYLSLPSATSCSGRIYNIKKVNSNNNVYLSAAGNYIDNDTILTLPATASGGLPSVKLISNGSQWFVLESLNGNVGIASDNLLAHWKLDGEGGDLSLLDATGNGYNLTLVNATYSACVVTGVVASGLSFDGTNDYAISNAGGIGTLQSFTTMGWVYYPTGSTEGDGWIDINSLNGFFIRKNSGQVRVSGSGDFSVINATNGRIQEDVWAHVAVTISSNATNSEYKLFVDGYFISSSVENLIDLNNDNIDLGRSQTTSYFEGRLDDVRIYNKALSEVEVRNIYTSMSELNISYYPKQFDQWTAAAGGTGSTPTVTANFATAPDGSLTADRVIFNLNGGTTSSDLSEVYNLHKKNVEAGTSYTFSLWAWTNDGSSKTLRVRDTMSRTTIATNFNIDGTPTKYSFVSTAISTDDATKTTFSIRLKGGSGTSDSADVLLWDAQLEETFHVGR